MMVKNVHEEALKLQSEVASALWSARALADHIARGTGGREVALVITKLQEAQSWLKLALDEMTSHDVGDHIL